jgi:ribosomal-protein-alanine N-acetyltransferase
MKDHGQPRVPNGVTLVLAKCALRDWRPGDEESLQHHADNPSIWNNVRDAFPHPYTMVAAHEWIENGSRKPGTVSLAIIVDGKAVGGIGLILGDDIYRKSAEIGFWLGEEFWGRGIMTEAVKAVTDYGFSTFGLVRIFAGVFEWNRASMKVLEKSGYHLEARLRKHVTKNGKSVDEVLYSVVRELENGPHRFRARHDPARE